MSDPTTMPTFALKSVSGPDPFTPQASPSQAFWGEVVTRLREILHPETVPKTLGDEPIYEKPCPTGVLIGQMGVIHYASHRQMLRVVLHSIEDSPIEKSGRCSVEMVVEFDDSTLVIPDLTIEIPVYATGMPDIALTIRSWDSLDDAMIEERCVYSRALIGKDRIPELVHFVLNRARRHRAACQESANMMQFDSGPNAAPVDEQVRRFMEAPRRAVSPVKALAPGRPTPKTARRTGETGAPAARQAPDPDAGPLGDALADEKTVEPLFPDFDPGPPGTRTEITLYDLDAIRREIAIAQPEDPTDRQVPGQTKMMERLHKLGTAGARRWLEHANATMIAGIEAVGARAPHFADVTDFVLMHARASLNTGTPMRLPPLLIVDEPGTGKTWYLSRLANALALPFTSLSMAGITTGDTIQGNNPSWRNSAQGIVSKLLLANPIANPVIFIDEFDKGTGAHGVQGSPYRPYYSALEPMNAEQFVDEFLGLAMNAAHILWVLAANDIDPLPSPIRSRVTQLKLQPMTTAHRITVAHSIYAEANARLNAWYDPRSAPRPSPSSRRQRRDGCARPSTVR